MKVLAIRTDEPQAELYLYDGPKKLADFKWQAHRKLAETIHQQITKILNESSISLNELDGLVCYKGPGSFTGLRIGMSVGNGLAYALEIPIVATSGDDWAGDGLKKLRNGRSDKIAVPRYGSPPKTTLAK